MLKKILAYIKQNIIIGLVGIYFIFSVILRASTGINITIPCLWKTISGHNCPGCGLTTAFEYLVKLEFKAAIDSNWLILILLPFGLVYIIKDFVRFMNRPSNSL